MWIETKNANRNMNQNEVQIELYGFKNVIFVSYSCEHK